MFIDNIFTNFHLDSPTVSLVRSGSFMSSPRQTNIAKKNSIDGSGILGTSSGVAVAVAVAVGGNGGGASDDSMHEKYFKSVENTPITKRRNQSLACTSDSSPHSPMSPKKNVSIDQCFSVFDANFESFLTIAFVDVATYSAKRFG